MSRLVVFVDGVRCGVVEQDPRGRLSFDYDPDYQHQPAATPLSLSMPLVVRHHPNRRIRPFLAGLLPDNEQALASMAREFGVSARSPFALISNVGRDVAGALQLLPPGEAFADSSDRHLPAMTSDELATGDVEALLVSVVEEYRDGTPPSALSTRFSLAGAQPKIALHRLASGWARPRGQTPTTHILKPVAGRFRRLDVVEHLTMRAAGHLGLSVAQTELAEFGSTRAFITTRYDRRFRDGRWARLHQEDICQALSVPPEHKYQHRDGGPGVGAIAQLFRSLPVRTDREQAAQAFYQALIFNTVVECTDAHAKNYSLILLGDRVRLAPLYDLTTWAPYRTGQPVYSAMRIGDEYAFARIGEPECRQAAKVLAVSADFADDTLCRIRQGVLGAFEAARDELASVDNETRTVAGEVVRAVSALPLVG